MARPPAKELTERELEVMHAFWNRGESTVAEIRDALAACGAGSGLHDGGHAGPDPGRQGLSDSDQ